MTKKDKKKVVIKELPAKVKIIRQIPKEDHQSQRPSGLEKREEEIENETISMPSQPNPIIIRPSPQPVQQFPRNVGNTAVQQSPQEDSQAVRRWYAQSIAQGSDRKYQTSSAPTSIIPQDTTFGRNPFSGSQDIQNVRGKSIDDEKNYDLSKEPGKKESRRRYPWEV